MANKVILSTDSNTMYSFFAPITCWMWEQFGFESVLYVSGDIQESVLKYLPKSTKVVQLEPIDTSKYKDFTSTQVQRLYGYRDCNDGDYVVLGDIDMFPLSNCFAQFPKDRITVMGHDITGYTEIPMCYVGAPKQIWSELFDDVVYNTYPYDKNNFNSYWSLDQRILTDVLKGKDINHIPRGTGSIGVGGRVCRSNWQFPEHPKEALIDCHAMRNGFHIDYFNRNMEVIKSVTNGWEWIYDYRTEFINEINYNG